ncbi:MAG: hypothetical protein OES24_03160 [Acidimicrobiia bacterium]|nr:hypothetical protein [Acidimicrobiia bacterium]
MTTGMYRLVGLAVLGCLAVGCSVGDDAGVGADADSAAGLHSEAASTESDTVVANPPMIVDGADVVAGSAPLALVVVQGPIAEDHSYVSVSWSHIDLARNPDEAPLAVGYEVARDGDVIAETTIDDEPWNDLAVVDDAVEPGLHRYQVRALLAAGPGPWSEPVTAEVRSTSDIGAVFAVDDYDGSDLEKAEQAVAAADAAGGGVVLFGAGTYSFDDALMIDGSGILLRGAGENETVLRASFPGSLESCGRVTPLLLFRGDPEELDVEVATTMPRGSTEIPVDGTPPFEVGDIVEIDGAIGQLSTGEFHALEIPQDPASGNDQRYPFEAGVVVGVADRSFTIDHPTSPVLTQGSSLYRYGSGRGNGIELMTLEGGGPEDRTYHRLIDARYQVDFRLAEVTGRWSNRNFLDASGHGITIVGFTGIEGGAAGYQPEPCKYKVGFGPATDVTVLDSTIGSQVHDRNMSLITMQFVYRGLVRNTVLGGSRTYGFNEHGGGSRDLVVENNWIGSGASGWSGILLGNDTWGFSGETAIRGNQFVDNVTDIIMVENSYGGVVAGNRSEGCSVACLTWSGWGGADGVRTAILEAADYGSARLLVTGNRFESEADGLDFGVDESNGFPWIGVRDLVVTDNVVTATGSALSIQGDATTSGRIWVTGNRFEGEVVAPTPGTDWWLWANDGGPATAEGELPSWIRLHQDWELNR